jgi:hypothetical protein
LARQAGPLCSEPISARGCDAPRGRQGSGAAAARVTACTRARVRVRVRAGACARLFLCSRGGEARLGSRANFELCRCSAPLRREQRVAAHTSPP